MQKNFPHCLSLILKEEGGNDDDPQDPGGRTSRGVTQERWNQYRKSHSGRPSDVWKASDDDIAEIYKIYYWEPWCGKLQSGVDLMYFNTCVNSGPGQANKEIQRCLHVIPDGKIGPKTIEACKMCTDVKSLVEDLADQRRQFYPKLKHYKRFGKGWMARTDRIEKAALKMV